MSRKVVAIAISLTVLLPTMIVTANAHTGQPDNVCRDTSDPSIPTYSIVCTQQPEVGQEVLSVSDGRQPIHLTVVFVDETSKVVDFEPCGHFVDGTPVPICLTVRYSYTVHGNN